MAVRRVFIAWSHSLFYESVRLLLNHPEVEIVGSASEVEIVWPDVIELRPDTIVIERNGEESETAASANILPIWKSSAWNPRIIQVGLQDNIVQVYRRKQHILPADLAPTIITQAGEVVSETPVIRSICSSCHDSQEAVTHMLLQTTADDSIETCIVCHGTGRDFDVVSVH